MLSGRGYVVLLVDSLGPRGHGEMCSIAGFDLTLYRKRPYDAYGALLFLQQLPFVRGDRIGLAGWSQGGGVTLYALSGRKHLGRPALSRQHFRTAVAFYPGACNEQRHPADWITGIPLLVLDWGGGEVDAAGALQNFSRRRYQARQRDRAWRLTPMPFTVSTHRTIRDASCRSTKLGPAWFRLSGPSRRRAPKRCSAFRPSSIVI